jgi:uncharacterized protein YecE (DUF72 family)
MATVEQEKRYAEQREQRRDAELASLRDRVTELERQREDDYAYFYTKIKEMEAPKRVARVRQWEARRVAGR